MSYRNQYEHRSIDRHAVVDLLRALAGADVVRGSGTRSRDEQRDRLARLCDSELERRFLHWLAEHGYRLPDDAQRTVVDARARPDFVYQLPANPVAVFVDGPHHDDAIQQTRDAAAAERLDDAGWTVVRIHHDADWAALVGQREWLFGAGRARE